MCLNTCVKRGRRTIHSIYCDRFLTLPDGSPLPSDWTFLSIEEKTKLKEAHMKRRKHFRTHGSLRTKHLNEFVRKMKANTLDDVKDL